MLRRTSIAALLAVALGVAWAATEAPPHRVLVPADEEGRLISGDQAVIVMAAQELDALLAQGRKAARTFAGSPVVVQSGRFEIVVEDASARIEGGLSVLVRAERALADLTTAGMATSAVLLGEEGVPLATDGRRLLAQVTQGSHVLRITGLAPVAQVGGSRQLSIALPGAAALDVVVRVQGKAIPSCEIPFTYAYDEESQATSIRLCPEGGKAFRITWREPKGQTQEEGILNCHTAGTVVADGETFAMEASLDVHIQLAARERLGIALPGGFVLEKVACDGMRRYAVEGDGVAKRLVLELVQPALGAVRIHVTGAIASENGAPVRIRPMTLEDAFVTWGTLNACAKRGLRLGVGSSDGMTRLPGIGGSATFSFDRADAFVDLGAAETPVRLDATVDAAMALSVVRTLVVADAHFKVVDGRLFQLAARVPADFLVVEESLEAGDVVTQRYWQELDGSRRRIVWQIPSGLKAGQKGRLRLILSLAHDVSMMRQGSFALPEIRIEDTEKLSGLYAVACDPAYRVHLADSKWVRAVPHEPLLEKGRVPPGTQLALRLEAPDYGASLQLVEQAPVVWAQAAVSIDVTRHAAIETAEIHYHIENGPTPEIFFSVPAREGPPPRIDVSEPTVRVGKTGTTDDERDLWQTQLAEPVMGVVSVTVRTEHDLQSDVGVITVDPPRSEGTLRESGEVSVSTQGALEVSCTPAGLSREEILTSEQLLAKGRRIIERYGYTRHPWQLTLETRRHGQAEVLARLVERVESNMMIDHGGKLVTDERILLGSRQFQTTELTLPEGAELWSVLVNGTPAKATTSGNVLSVSLPRGQSEWGWNAIRVIYKRDVPSVRGVSKLKLAHIGLPEEVPVGNTFTNLYLDRNIELAWADLPFSESRHRTLWARPILEFLPRTCVPMRAQDIVAMLGIVGVLAVLLAIYAYLRRTGRGPARSVAIMLGMLLLFAGLIALLLPALGRAREEARKTQSRSNLRQIGLALTIYANDNRGWAPSDLHTLLEGGYLTQKGAGVLWNSGADREQIGNETNYRIRTSRGRPINISSNAGNAIAWEDPEDCRETNSINVLYSDGSVKTFRGVDLFGPGPYTEEQMNQIAATYFDALYSQNGDRPASAGEGVQRLATLGEREDIGIVAGLPAEEPAQADQRAAGRPLLDRAVASGPARPEEGILSMPLVVDPTGRHYHAARPSATKPFTIAVASSKALDATGTLVFLAVLAAGVRLRNTRASVRAGVLLIVFAVTHGAATVLAGAFVAAANGALLGAGALGAYYFFRLGILTIRAHKPAAAAAAPMLLIAAVTIAMLSSSGPALAEEAPSGASSDELVRELLARLSPKKPVALREDTVYIPYTLTPSGRVAPTERCYLTEKLYDELSRAAKGDAEVPAADWMGVSAQYKAVLRDGHVELEAVFELLTLKEMAGVPLAVGGINADHARIEGPPGTGASISAEGLLVAPEPGRYRVTFTGVAPEAAHVQTGALSLDLPAFPAGALTLAVPTHGALIDFDVQPAEKPCHIAVSPADTVLTLAAGGGGPLGIAWRPRVHVAREKQLLTARTDSLAFVGATAVATLTRVEAALRVGTTAFLALNLPPATRVSEVASTDIKTWRVVDNGQSRQLQISYNNAWSGRKAIHVMVLRGRSADEETIDLAGDIARIEGVEHTQGTILAAVLPTVDGVIGNTRDVRFVAGRGLVKERRQTWAALPENPYRKWLLDQLDDATLSGFEFVGARPSAEMAVSRAKHPLEVEVRADLVVAQEHIEVSAQVSASRGGLPFFSIPLTVPADVILDEVDGERVERWELDADGGRLVVVPTEATTELRFTLRGRVPIGATETFEMPALGCPEADKHSTIVRIRAAEGVEVTVENAEGLAAARRSEGEEEWPYVFVSKRNDYGATLKVQRLAPSVLADVWVQLMVEEASYAYDAHLGYDVKRAPVEKVSFALPQQLAAAGVSIEGPVRETIRTVAEGAVRYDLILERPLIGRFEIVVSTSDALAGEEFAAPELVVLDAYRTVVHVAVANKAAAKLDVKAHEGLAPQATRDSVKIPEWIDRKHLVRLFSAQGSWRLALAVERYVTERGLEVFVDKTTLTTVVDGTRAITHAGFDVYNRSAQMMQVTLPAEAELWAASIAGYPVEVARIEGQNAFQIPLLKVAAEKERLNVELIYEQPAPVDASSRLEPPILEGITVSQTDWFVVVPEALRAKVQTNMQFVRVKTTERLMHRSMAAPTEVQGQTRQFRAQIIHADEKTISLKSEFRKAMKAPKAKKALMDQSKFLEWYSEKDAKKGKAEKVVVRKVAETVPEVIPPQRIQRDDAAMISKTFYPQGTSYLYTIAGRRPWVELSVTPAERGRRTALAAAAIALAALAVGLVILRPARLPARWGRWVSSKWALLAGLAVVCAILTVFLPAVVLAAAAAIAYRHRAPKATPAEAVGPESVSDLPG